MPSQYAIQHEFDNEATYVVHDSDTQLKDQDCVAFGSNLPVQLRLRLAGLVRDELNRANKGQPVRREGPIPLPTIVICVSGGVVQEVYADPPAPRVVLIDWDTEGSPDSPQLVEIEGENGHRVRVWVAEINPLPPPDAGSEIGQALRLASFKLCEPSASSPIRDPALLNHTDLVRFAQKIQALFYLDITQEREFWNPDKEWEGADLLDELAQVMQQFGLVPLRIADAPL